MPPDQGGIKAQTARAIAINAKKGRGLLFCTGKDIYNDLVRRSGAIVFSSSRGGEFSYECDRIRNGYFVEFSFPAVK